MKVTVLHELNILYPLKTEYQIAFLKRLINELEENGADEIHDSIYEQLAIKLNEEKGEFSYKHFQIQPDTKAITVKESNSFIRDGTTGLKLWPAAISLAEFILQNPEKFNEKSILELGSGAQGFVGLTTIRTCNPAKVYLSDCHEKVLEHLIENVNLNLKQDNPEIDFQAKSVLVREKLRTRNGTEAGIFNLPWEEIETLESELKSLIIPDTLLAADVVYDDTIFDALFKCINSCFKIAGPSLQFFLSQTIRSKETFEKFCNLLHHHNFVFHEERLENEKILHNDSTSEIKILRITRNLC